MLNYLNTLPLWLLCLTSAFAQTALPIIPAQAGTISVSGEATIYVVPDQILVHFGVESKNMELVAAQQENKTISDAALQSIKAQGVASGDIQTDYLEVEPRYDYHNGEQRFLGYVTRSSFVVTLRDKEKLEPIIAKALEAGVNYIHGIEFRTTELRKHRDEARRLAIRAAADKGAALAGELGVKLGKPTNIREENIHNWYRYHSGWRERRDTGYMSQNVVQHSGGDSGGSADTIHLGKIAVKASVAVVFALVDAAP